jgi:predicted transcriptional regulator
MVSTNLKTDQSPHLETEKKRQRRLADEADAADSSDPSAAERRRQRTLRGLADVDAGRLIDDEAMQAWAGSLGTDHELPVPEPE